MPRCLWVDEGGGYLIMFRSSGSLFFGSRLSVLGSNSKFLVPDSVLDLFVLVPDTLVIHRFIYNWCLLIIRNKSQGLDPVTCGEITCLMIFPVVLTGRGVTNLGIYGRRGFARLGWWVEILSVCVCVCVYKGLFIITREHDGDIIPWYRQTPFFYIFLGYVGMLPTNWVTKICAMWRLG